MTIFVKTVPKIVIFRALFSYTSNQLIDNPCHYCV